MELRRVLGTVARLFLLLILCAGAAPGQTPAQSTECAADTLGNKVCIGSQASQNVCGCGIQAGGCGAIIYCRNVAVQKTGLDGGVLFTQVLGGASDQLPFGFAFDTQNDIVVLGTTYSKDFPVSPDALQPVYGGPQPPFTYGSPIRPGGDGFLSVLSPAGTLLYSTYLGTSLDDTILGMDVPADGKIDVLVSAGSSNFPLVPAGGLKPLWGPTLVTFDLNARRVVRSQYLPVAYSQHLTYVAMMEPGGRVTVATEKTLYGLRAAAL